MYVYNVKLLTKNEKELDALTHTVRIYNQNIGIEFDIEEYAKLVMK